MIEWFFGFLPRWYHPCGIFGHVEAWGYTEDQTWLFLDPQSIGFRVEVMHRYDDVIDALEARNLRCSLILKHPGERREFRLPIHGPMTCARVCGSLVGIRALVPATLRRKLLANGAEVVHGQAKGKSRGQEGAAA